MGCAHALGHLEPVVHDVGDDDLGGPHGAGCQEVDKADGASAADEHLGAELDPSASVNARVCMRLAEAG